MRMRKLYITAIAILIVILFTLLLVQLVHAAIETEIWTAICMAGTWVVIEHDIPGQTEFSVWCAKFNWETRELIWRWGLSCHPLWGVKIVIWEMGNGNPILFCRYR